MDDISKIEKLAAGIAARLDGIDERLSNIEMKLRDADAKYDALCKGVYYWLERISGEVSNDGDLAHGLYYWLNRISADTTDSAVDASDRLRTLEEAVRALLVAQLMNEIRGE